MIWVLRIPRLLESAQIARDTRFSGAASHLLPQRDMRSLVDASVALHHAGSDDIGSWRRIARDLAQVVPPVSSAQMSTIVRAVSAHYALGPPHLDLLGKTLMSLREFGGDMASFMILVSCVASIAESGAILDSQLLLHLKRSLSFKLERCSARTIHSLITACISIFSDSVEHADLYVFMSREIRALLKLQDGDEGLLVTKGASLFKALTKSGYMDEALYGDMANYFLDELQSDAMRSPCQLSLTVGSSILLSTATVLLKSKSSESACYKANLRLAQKILSFLQIWQKGNGRGYSFGIEEASMVLYAVARYNKLFRDDASGQLLESLYAVCFRESRAVTVDSFSRLIRAITTTYPASLPYAQDVERLVHEWARVVIAEPPTTFSKRSAVAFGARNISRVITAIHFRSQYALDASVLDRCRPTVLKVVESLFRDIPNDPSGLIAGQVIDTLCTLRHVPDWAIPSLTSFLVRSSSTFQLGRSTNNMVRKYTKFFPESHADYRADIESMVTEAIPEPVLHGEADAAQTVAVVPEMDAVVPEMDAI